MSVDRSATTTLSVSVSPAGRGFSSKTPIRRRAIGYAPMSQPITSEIGITGERHLRIVRVDEDDETVVEDMKDTELIALLDRHRADIKIDLGGRIDTVSDQVGSLRTETTDRLDRIADEVGQLRTDLTGKFDALTTTVTDFRIESSQRITRLEAQFATTISLSKWGIGILVMILIAIIGAAVSGN